ncbi:D-3-phosphoglycerate dehydrogenase [Oxobacter pfennigii]|uniref:D-3-phosphoglycerate dehydrogenase n=1 Tax=Oxobacter pfennigii TaxID=36849 RepID=A0A0P8W1L0_9CLOT|nr:3-phosphoglycerate dehydrogenase family protein [Oxobacter pfennigii]KPU42315.1 D-3-phosphoglycerate dehydrogenase [Oxobacter pfennigii]
MYTVKTLNNISKMGLDLLPSDKYTVSENVENPDAIIVRSANMLDMELPSNLKAIARAGAGVNNIPIDKCSEKGIIVFNTPGANANAVKELVLTALFLSSRHIYQGMNWAKTLIGKGDEVGKLVEKGKSQFEGPEIKGKRIGVIGLGAVGVMVANDALALGMDVIGYDPFISISSAWGLSCNVIRASSLDNLIATSDYISIHIPLSSKTKGMFNKDKFNIMKKGARLINLARGELVETCDVLEALDKGILSCYVTDFPCEELLKHEGVINIPHLGASTPESEENCAIMAALQVKDFLENGTVRNSINFPDCELEHSGNLRLTTVHSNIPNMIGQITTILAQNKINIANMLTHQKEELAYSIIDIDAALSADVVERIKKIEGLRMVRVLCNP